MLLTCWPCSLQVVVRPFAHNMIERLLMLLYADEHHSSLSTYFRIFRSVGRWSRDHTTFQQYHMTYSCFFWPFPIIFIFGHPGLALIHSHLSLHIPIFSSELAYWLTHSRHIPDYLQNIFHAICCHYQRFLTAPHTSVKIFNSLLIHQECGVQISGYCVTGIPLACSISTNQEVMWSQVRQTEYGRPWGLNITWLIGIWSSSRKIDRHCA